MKRKLELKLEKTQILPLFLASCLLTFAACSNAFLKSLSGQVTTTATGTPSTTPINQEVISSVKIALPQGVATGIPTATLFFDTTKSTAPISNHCNVSGSGSAQTSKACNCQFSWNQVTSATGTNPLTGLPNAGSTVPHKVLTAVSAVQPSQIACPAPSIYNTEVPAGTQINITVLPGSNNPDSGTFEVPTFGFIKPSSTGTGNFSDSQGNLFDNVLRYSCYG
jgi:hypothetical protein